MAATSAQLLAAASAEKSPRTTMPTNATTTNATRAATQRTITMRPSSLFAPLAVARRDRPAEALEQLGLHALGVDGRCHRGRRPLGGLGAEQAAGGIHVRARVAGQLLLDRLHHEVGAQERSDERDRVVQVGAVDAVGPLVERDVEAQCV